MIVSIWLTLDKNVAGDVATESIKIIIILGVNLINPPIAYKIAALQQLSFM